MLEFTGFCVVVIVLVVVGRFVFLWWYRRGLRERTYGYSDWFRDRANVPWSGGNGPHDTNMKNTMAEARGWSQHSDITGPQEWRSLKNGSETPPERG